MAGHPQQGQHRGQWSPPRQGGGGKALPVAVGAGLAVGVFLGLLLIRGTGSEAEAETSETSEPIAANEADAAPVVDTPDAAVVAAVVPDAAPVGPVAKKLTLTLAVTPKDLENLEITIDGEPLDGTPFSYDLEPEAKPKRVTVVVKAKGHRRFKDKVTIEKDETLEVALKARKRGTGGGSGKTRPGGPGGLIDL